MNPRSSGTLRAFVAVYPSPAQRERVGTLVDGLAAHVAAGSGGGPTAASVRWVAAEGAHLTLAFLGDVDRDALSDIGATVAAAARAHAPFPLALGALGAFPDLERPRVVWLGLRLGEEDLVALADDVRRRLGRDDAAPFRPHLTLGRVRQRATAAERRVTSARRCAGRASGLPTNRPWCGRWRWWRADSPRPGPSTRSSVVGRSRTRPLPRPASTSLGPLLHSTP